MHSAGVEGSIAFQLEGAEVQTVMDKFWATAKDHYKGLCQSYNPAPPATLQLTDKNHNAAAGAAAGVCSTSIAAAAAPDQALVSYQQLKEVCQCVDTLVKEVYQYCLAQREEGHLADEVINNTQGKLCDDVKQLETLAKPLLAEMLRNSNIEQSVTMQFPRYAPEMQLAATKKFHQLKVLINSDRKQQQLKKKASDPDQHQTV